MGLEILGIGQWLQLRNVGITYSHTMVRSIDIALDSSAVSSNPGISHLLNPDDSPRNRLSETSALSNSSYGSSAAPQVRHRNRPISSVLL